MSNKQAIIHARALPRIMEQNQSDLYNPLVGIIGKVFLMAGQEIGKTDLQALANAMSNTLCRKFTALTIQEVNIAMEKGVMKEYGKYFGLNIVTFNDWLLAYMDSSERLEAIEKQMKTNAIEAPKEPTTAELIQMKKETILYGLKVYQSHGVYSRNPQHLYRYLEEFQLITLSPAEKKDLMVKANTTMDEEFKNLKTKKNVTKQLGDILDGMLNPRFRTDKQIAIYAMQMAINGFYKQIVDEGTDLEELLKNNK